MKKKIFALTMIIAMVAIIAVSGTLAYFQDTDAQTNVFTIGEIKVDLFEDFNTEDLDIHPGVPVVNPETGKTEISNTIEKEVYVENTGKNLAYVRVQIAVPAFERDGAPIDVFNLIHNEASTADGKWSWASTAYATDIGGVPYKVFVVTYGTALAKDAVTEDAIESVYMDSDVTQEEIAAWNAAYGEGVWNKIYVVAEAAQEDGFSDAATALDTAFGVPGSYAVNFTAAAEGDTLVERTSIGGK